MLVGNPDCFSYIWTANINQFYIQKETLKKMQNVQKRLELM